MDVKILSYFFFSIIFICDGMLSYHPDYPNSPRMDTIRRKWALFSNFLTVSWMTKFANRDVGDLFALIGYGIYVLFSSSLKVNSFFNYFISFTGLILNLDFFHFTGFYQNLLKEDLPIQGNWHQFCQ